MQLIITDFTTCMETYWNGVGTGLEVIRVVLRLTLSERLPGLTGCYAAGAGTSTVCTCVLRFGATSTRSIGTSTSASGWCVPEFCKIRRNARAGANGVSEGWAWSNSGKEEFKGCT